MHYRSFGYTQEDNFSRLDINKAHATLTVRVFDRDGRLIVNRQDDDDMKKRPLTNVLKLAPWT
jgi:alkaline phosphatase D